MGHIKATRQGIRSTKKKENEESIEIETVNETDKIIDDKEELEPPNRTWMEQLITK